jgi:DNA repair photolyase
MTEHDAPGASDGAREQALLIREVECKSILTRSGIPSVDYAVNPYVGCEHGCVYCYATFMKRFTGHEEEWGTFVDVRVNAPQVLERQLRRASPGNISFGTVTDAYQPLETKYALTRACLKALLDYDFPVSILTKSALVWRDLDLLKKLKAVEVAFTITTPDDEVRNIFEPRSSPIRARLEALRALAEAGISTWAFCGPLLPFVSDSDEQLHALFTELKRARVGHVLVDSLNLRGAAWGRVRRTLQAHYPDLVDSYQALRNNRKPYHAALMERSRRIAVEHGLEWRGVDLDGDEEARS